MLGRFTLSGVRWVIPVTARSGVLGKVREPFFLFCFKLFYSFRSLFYSPMIVVHVIVVTPVVKLLFDSLHPLLVPSTF